MLSRMNTKKWLCIAAALTIFAAQADLSVATSGIVNVSEKKRERNPLTPRELAMKVHDHDGRVALVFGPEDDGLNREQIMACDVVVTIPTSSDYPVMNLSHAASTLFYELWVSRHGLPTRQRSAASVEKEMLHEKFAELLGAIQYPEHKMEKTSVLFRRTTGRAVLSKWEFHTLMGVFDRSIKVIDGRIVLKRRPEEPVVEGGKDDTTPDDDGPDGGTGE